MDDLAKKLNDLLNSPEGLQKLQSAAASIGMFSGEDSKGNTSDSPAQPVSAEASSDVPPSDNNPLGDIETIQKLIPLFNNFKNDNEDTILLKALRPYLQDERQQRLDETIKIMHMLKVLPLLNEKWNL